MDFDGELSCQRGNEVGQACYLISELFHFSGHGHLHHLVCHVGELVEVH